MFFNDFVTDRASHAKELLPSLKRDGVEISKLPTGGVNVGGRNYLAYMSVHHFGRPGQWITNYGGIACSDDGGQTWVDAPIAGRPNTPGLAPQPTGPWGAPMPVATSRQYPTWWTWRPDGACSTSVAC